MHKSNRISILDSLQLGPAAHLDHGVVHADRRGAAVASFAVVCGQVELARSGVVRRPWLPEGRTRAASVAVCPHLSALVKWEKEQGQTNFVEQILGEARARGPLGRRSARRFGTTAAAYWIRRRGDGNESCLPTPFPWFLRVSVRESTSSLHLETVSSFLYVNFFATSLNC